MAATPETRKDAANRSGRTFFQGAIAVVVVAVASVTLDTVTPGTVLDWPEFAVAAGTAAVTAVIAYVHRRINGADKDTGAAAGRTVIDVSGADEQMKQSIRRILRQGPPDAARPLDGQ